MNQHARGARLSETRRTSSKRPAAEERAASTKSRRAPRFVGAIRSAMGSDSRASGVPRVRRRRTRLSFFFSCAARLRLIDARRLAAFFRKEEEVGRETACENEDDDDDREVVHRGGTLIREGASQPSISVWIQDLSQRFTRISASGPSARSPSRRGIDSEPPKTAFSKGRRPTQRA